MRPQAEEQFIEGSDLGMSQDVDIKLTIEVRIANPSTHVEINEHSHKIKAH